MNAGRSTTVVTGDRFVFFSPFLLAVDALPPFLPVPLLLSDVISAVILM